MDTASIDELELCRTTRETWDRVAWRQHLAARRGKRQQRPDEETGIVIDLDEARRVRASKGT